MKKKSKIRVLKGNQKSDEIYTFVIDNDIDMAYTPNAKDSSKTRRAEGDIGAIDAAGDMNKIRKKKRVLTNEDVRKTSKGLKFNNPSQRNHSSVYE